MFHLNVQGDNDDV